MKLKKSFFGIFNPIHKATLLVSDVLCLAGSFYLATNIRLQTTPDFYSLEYIAINFIIISCLFIGGAYTSSAVTSKPKLPLKTFFTAIASALPVMLFIYLLGPDRFTALFGRGVFPFAVLAFGLLAIITRLVLNYALNDQNKRAQVLLLGSSASTDRINKLLSSHEVNIKIQHKKTITSETELIGKISALIITPDHSPDKEEQQALINLRLVGVPIFSLSDFFENYLFLVPVQEINNDWFIRAEGFTMLHSSITTRIKRAMDIALALVLVIITAPITISTALAIKLTSNGPIFFSQTRVGIKNQKFTLYKFRTMAVDSEKNGPRWAENNDSRIIPIGHFLRKSRIDELPQCWNILRGEMSIIGPRPERPEFTSTLSKKIPYYELRHIIKPGLTGWAQVMYPYGASVEDALRKLQFDLYYIKNYSLILDLNILLRTVLITLRRKGR